MPTLFGPVNSRRLGKSLGVDLLPFKTCSLDCIYCECGWTTQKTLTRDEFVPTQTVLAELDAFLATRPALDYVTFSGAGEPTLHSGIGAIIRHLKTHYPQYKVAVLTNGTLLGDERVHTALNEADLVIPSLDGATDRAFEAICRPAPGLSVQAVIEGTAAFRKQFPGLLLLEIFIVPGENDSETELAALKQAAIHIAPDAVQLNSLDRPAPGAVAIPTQAQLEAIRRYFHPLQVQPVRRRVPGEAAPWDNPDAFAEILAALRHGPRTLAQLSVATGIREGDLAKTLAQMVQQDWVRQDARSGEVIAQPRHAPTA